MLYIKAENSGQRIHHCGPAECRWWLTWCGLQVSERCLRTEPHSSILRIYGDCSVWMDKINSIFLFAWLAHLLRLIMTLRAEPLLKSSCETRPKIFTFHVFFCYFSGLWRRKNDIEEKSNDIASTLKIPVSWMTSILSSCLMTEIFTSNFSP